MTSYDCGLSHRAFTDGRPAEWLGYCRNATAACLRTGATLHPTAIETAQKALVAACFDEADAERELQQASFDQHQLALEAAGDASEKRRDAIAAYRAALERAK